MPIIGITGGVATGKSTFRKLLLDRFTAEFFDSDVCARDLLDHDEEVRRLVLETVSREAYGPDGRPNRPLLREVVYNDEAKRRALEAALHPVIRDRWTARARELTVPGENFVVDIPLLFETKAESSFDSIITIACSRETQISRIEQTRGLSRELAEKMIASQMDLGLKIRLSTYVIWNDGSFDALVPQVENLARCLVNV